jgi:hypothetical protein
MKRVRPALLMGVSMMLALFGVARSLKADPPRQPTVALPPREAVQYTGRDWHVFRSGSEFEIGGGTNYLAN